MTNWPRALVIAAWIGSVFSGALALIFVAASAISFHLSRSEGARSGSDADWQIYALIAWLGIASLLLLPPLWKKRSKTTAYVRVAAGFALLIGAMFMPIETHAVKLDMPKPSAATK